MTNPIIRNQLLGQSTWYDNISRGLIASGDLKRLIDNGITGITSNPTIFEKAISGSDDYDLAIIDSIDKGDSSQQTFEMIGISDIQHAADSLRPIYDLTEGNDGYASFELPPSIAHDKETTVREGIRLFSALDRPNVMIKVPATPEGIQAFRVLTSHGINVNMTLIFSLVAYSEVMLSYLDGLESLDANGQDLSKVGSVASFFISRVDTAIDSLIAQRADRDNPSIRNLLGTAAIANAQSAYAKFQRVFSSSRFVRLKQKGARPQKPLWASTSTKNPSYSDTLYIDNLIGPDTVNTMPEVAIHAVLNHGVSASTIVGSGPSARRNLQRLAKNGIDMETIASQLLKEGVDAFATSYNTVLRTIEEKASSLGSQPYQTKVFPHNNIQSILATQLEIEKSSVIPRIWQHDHTLWNKKPDEISDRLGWLRLPETIRPSMGMVNSLAQNIKSSGSLHVVLMGMGGTGLSPKVYTEILPTAEGHPALIHLDSTVPETVQKVTDTIDPNRTTFIVASKSGGTVEIHAFYKHFRAIADAALGRSEAGRRFIAITDAGSPLEEEARSEGFGTVLLNPPDVGGRFSALSLFGLAPAAIAGVDVNKVLDSAERMKALCENPNVNSNPGAQLGAVIASLCTSGVDKLTLLTSPKLRPFAMWVEQMIAESLGKNGTGIIPIENEPMVPTETYNTDRVFAYIRLIKDNNYQLDMYIAELSQKGFPSIRVDVHDITDIGMEIYRWEFATAVAGQIMGVHPFNQENVQGAKAFTQNGLAHYITNGELPVITPTVSLQEILTQAIPSDYLSFQVYLAQSKVLDDALATLRRTIIDKFRIATTVGYGPRYLHSTGELHKGGPPNGIYVQIVLVGNTDVPIPGLPYGFKVLAHAQAYGDFQALKALGRRIIRLQISEDAIFAVNKLSQQMRPLSGSI
jgi:transaldolase/glucose-6-phosphate isomerase